jgi:hypothetical protein
MCISFPGIFYLKGLLRLTANSSYIQKETLMLKILFLLSLAAATSSPSYLRSEWGSWVDADGDCQDTRQEVLIQESITTVALDPSGCRVLEGRWYCPFTGKIFTNPSDLDIDHMIPLKEAFQAGGKYWNSDKKKRFFNDLSAKSHLVAVSKSANRSKGSRRPDQWLPSNPEYRCFYIRDWVYLKNKWNLTFAEAEKDFLNIMWDACGYGPPAPVASPR